MLMNKTCFSCDVCPVRELFGRMGMARTTDAEAGLCGRGLFELERQDGLSTGGIDKLLWFSGVANEGNRIGTSSMCRAFFPSHLRHVDKVDIVVMRGVVG
jgi:hypothetical protein